MSMWSLIWVLLSCLCNLSSSAIYSSYECNNGLIRRAKLNATSELPDRAARFAILNDYHGGKSTEEYFRLMNRNFSVEEWQQIRSSSSPIKTFFRLWALKESYVKALGVGITLDLRKVSFQLNSLLENRLEIQTNTKLYLNGSILKNWIFHEYLFEDGNHCATVAFETIADHGNDPKKLSFDFLSVDDLLVTDVGGGFWSPSSNNFKQYLTIEFNTRTYLRAIATQGNTQRNEYVTDFYLEYSKDGHAWFQVTNILGDVETFQANTDGKSIVLNEFEVPIIAQFIRINPVRWNGRISLRVELYGCDYESDLLHFNGSAFIKRDFMREPIQSLKDFIRFRFKTDQANGLIMYSEGVQGDLFALNLKDNKMYLHINLGMEHVTTLKVGSLLDNDLWHDVVIYRNRHDIEFSVDRVRIKDEIKGSFSRLDLDRGFYVGGLPVRKTVIGDVFNFTGCIENLYMNATNFISEAKEFIRQYEYGSKYHKTDGILFSCPESREIPVTFTSSKSYVRLNGYEDVRTMNVTLSFRTFEDRGLLMYHKFQSRGFVKLFLEKGKVKIMLAPLEDDPGYTPVYDNFNDKFNDGKWHSLVLTMAKDLLVISIDGQQMKTIRSLKFSTGLTYYIAGHPELKDVGFIGCMKSIGIDGNYRQPPDWTKDQYCCSNTVIFATCLMNDKCDPNPCQNNGVCYQNSNEFLCDCTNTGYSGAICRTPLHPLSCIAYKNINSLTDNQLEVSIMIDIDGSGSLKPFPVSCNFVGNGKVLTYVHHLNESYTHINDANYSLPGSYIHDLEYDADFDQMEALVNRSKNCHQNMIFKCKSLSLFNSPYKSDNINDFNPLSWWTNSRNQKMNYWGGGVPGSQKCYCGVHNNCIDKSKFCNCDSQMDTWQEDAGDVMTKEHLPIRQVRVGGIMSTGDYTKEAMFKVGPLVCEGDTLYENTITFRLSDAVLMLPTVDLQLRTDIYFEFKTTVEDAVFFHSRGAYDFIKLSIISGHKLVFEYQTVAGTVAVNLPVSSRLADNNWHSVFVERNRKEAKILLDGAISERSQEYDGPIRPLNLGDTLVFGADADHNNGYVGCIRALQINGQTVNMKSFARIFRMYGLSDGCIGKCDSSPCLNNGTCFEHYKGYTCDCRWSSFKGPICADEIGVTMRSNSIIKYDFMGSWRSTISESIRVGFTTANPKGFLLGLFSNISGEYLTVMISNSGHLRVVFDFGFERQEIIYPDKNFGIAQFHDVHISRKESGSVMVLKVDNYPPKEYKFNIKLSADAQFNNVQYLYIGKNETMGEGFIGCISRVEFDDIYPLKLLFQQNPPPNVRSLGGSIREDYCGVEPLTHPPDAIEVKPLPDLNRDELLKAYNQTNSALWGSLLILLILALVVLGLVASRYIAYYKGEYLTQEDVGADIALDSDTAVVNSITGHHVQKKKEWFI